MFKPFAHSYPKFFLLNQKLTIEGTGDFLKIDLDFIHSNFPSHFKMYPKLTTKIQIGRYERESIIKNITYDELVKEGYCIQSKPVREKWFANQSRIYEIVPYTKDNLLNIPHYHNIQKDFVNDCIRLIGSNTHPSGYGPWIYLSIKKRINKKEEDMTYAERMALRFNDASFLKNVSAKMVEIDEIPVLLSWEGILVCIPLKRDEPKIGIVGKPGSGKSLLLHRIADCVYWKWNKRICILNDKLNETETWCQPNKTSEFLKKLMVINEEARPLPIVYLYPNTNTLKRMVYEDECISTRITIPFEEVIYNHQMFSLGKKEWALERSGTRLHPELKKKIIELGGDLEQIEKLIELDGKLRKSKGVQEKFASWISAIFDEQIVDANTNIKSKIKVEGIENYSEDFPLNVIMATGLVPSLVTSNLVTKHYFKQYFRFIINSLFNNQAEGYFVKEKLSVWLFCDEIAGITTLGGGEANESIIRCVTEGRNNRLGFVYATQVYTRVLEEIRGPTLSYLFCFQYKDNDQINRVCGDFDLGKTYKNIISELEKFNCVAVGSEDFVCYDLKTGRRFENKGPYVGEILPPLSQPKPPTK